MKIFKYMLFVVVLIFSVFFIIQLTELNQMVDGSPIRIKIPYLTEFDGINPDGIKVWEAIILTLSAGVFLGFIIALFQMIAQKSEIISLKSKVRRLNSELDNLRNHDIDDEINILEDDNEDTEI